MDIWVIARAERQRERERVSELERERETHTHTHIHTHTGQALASYPGVKQLFDALGGITLTRGEVQAHVDTASAAVKDI